MSTLYDFNNAYTDKQQENAHHYFDTYTSLFEKRRQATDVMEIGVREGGSINLWCHYFPQATVYGIEQNSDTLHWELLDEFTGRFTIKFADAYDKMTAESYGAKKFDIIIDDGSHTFENQLQFIQFYFDLLKEDGVMIIEDIQNFDYCEQFKMYVPVEFHDCIRIYDLRGISNQYDDVLFVIDKALKPEPLVP